MGQSDNDRNLERLQWIAFLLAGVVGLLSIIMGNWTG